MKAAQKIENQTPEQEAYYRLRKSQKSEFFYDYGYKFRRSAQTGQLRFKNGNLTKEEVDFFWKFVVAKGWVDSLDVPDQHQYQLTVFSADTLRNHKRTQLSPPPPSASTGKHLTIQFQHHG